MKYPIIAVAIVLAFSGAAMAEDANSHAAHQPNPTQAADQKAAQATSPTARPTEQAAVGKNTNCPMMGSTNGAPQQQMDSSGKMMPMQNGTAQTGMNCPMLQQHPPHSMTLHHDSPR